MTPAPIVEQQSLAEKGHSAPLPTGVITLVFTDIEGSTQLWESYPASFRASLDAHNAMLRQVLARWGGHEVKCQGDSFMLAFERATSAIYCAIDFQRELSQHAWNTDAGQPLVRIGIHTGEPFRGYDAAGRPDYFGPMVNRSSRIADAGHGGQILLSASARDVAAGALSTDVQVVDLGHHRLRGIEAPEQIFEVRHPDLFESETGVPRRYPPLRTQDVLRSNLPIYSTSFVGRNRELPELIEVLNQSDTRLLTVIGFGGMGKTRLTLQLAERCSHAFQDGAWWVELEEARTGESMVQRIAYHLGLHLQPEPSVREQLLDYLRPRRLLLVLDNVEQVPDAADVVAQLLKNAPHIKIVATSRRALGLQIERVKEVLPLPPGDAGSLFVDRACAQMQFQLTTDNQADVEELCRRVEGIPLAIELAASRATTLSPREIVKRLGERLELLQSNAPDLPPRQRALRGAMDWSHSLLSFPEQDLFAQLSVFTGGFSLADAEAICRPAGNQGSGVRGQGSEEIPDGNGVVELSDDASGVLQAEVIPTTDHRQPTTELSVLGGVAHLRSHSLLRSEIAPQTQETRYFMLEALRDYAFEKLQVDPSRCAEIAARHAAYFLPFTQERVALLRGPDATRAIAELESAYDNIRAATDWSARHGHHLQCARLCLAVGAFLQCRGFGHEALRRLHNGRECLEKVAASSDNSGLSPLEYSRLEGALLREIAGAQLDHFHWELARETAQRSLACFTHCDDARGMAQATNLLGLADKAEKRFDSAREKFTRALEIFQSQSDRIGEALVLNNLGLIEYGDAGGEPAKASNYWQQALAIHRELDDKRGIAQVLTNLGALAQEQERPDEAWASFVEALRWERELHHAFGVGRTLSNLGEVAEMKGQAPRAHRLYCAARCLFTQVGSPYENYVAGLLLQLTVPDNEEWSQAELREKSLDDLVRWALESAP